jgi:hypothetical protein
VGQAVVNDAGDIAAFHVARVPVGCTASTLMVVSVAAVTDAGIRRRPVLGAVDEFVDSTDALGRTKFLRAAIAAASPPGGSHASA